MGRALGKLFQRQADPAGTCVLLLFVLIPASLKGTGGTGVVVAIFLPPGKSQENYGHLDPDII